MTYVLLGAFGDLLAFLPLLWHEAKAGAKPRLMVSRQYADLLEGVSYVEPVVFEGGWLELDKAMEQARALDPKAVCVQITGTPDEVRKWTYINGPDHAVSESFEKEMWRLAGKLALWREQPPLVFDKRDSAREAVLVDSIIKPRPGRKRKLMLVHADGKTSPFPYRQLLWRFLELAFPQWEKLDLGKVKAERIYDLLGLYERADLLIAADSACLHLARGVPRLPVIALAKDAPTLWHGSAWRPQHTGYFRYSDFPHRIADFERKIASIDSCTRQSVRLLLLWNEYDIEVESARPAIPQGRWATLGVERGSIGRDSRKSLQDANRIPFVKDVLRLGCLKASDDAALCLIKPDVALEKEQLETVCEMAGKGQLCYAHRRVVSKETGQPLWHPAVDLFCFPKKWWQAHQEEMPDMVMGTDYLWERTLLEVLKRNGAVELTFGVKKMEENA